MKKPTSYGTNATTLCINSENQSEKIPVLPTARVTLFSKGKIIQIQALIDTASEISLITENVVKKLNLETFKSDVNLTGLSETHVAKSTLAAKVVVKTKNEKIMINANIVPNISVVKNEVATDQIKHLLKLNLADPEFNKPQNISLLIGAQDYPKFMKGEYSPLIATDTKLGKILIRV